ncbi:AbiU2 domain-containing protein [Thermomonas fusca]
MRLAVFFSGGSTWRRGLTQVLGSMDNLPAHIASKLEDQLAQVIERIGAIRTLHKLYQEQIELRQDTFLFNTMYDSLWDSAIVRIGTMWDKARGVASLPNLAKQLRRMKNKAADAVAVEIEINSTAEWLRLKEWRDAIIAHARVPLDPVAFNRDYELSVLDVEKESQRIEFLLTKATDFLGQLPVYYPELRERADSSAQNSLDRWVRDAA